jgi:aromatic ring-opening dioxygenase catalytic subunit (LigB family)
MTSMQRMPVLFIGHGNPMNEIEENSFTKVLMVLGKKTTRKEDKHVNRNRNGKGNCKE